VKSPEYLEPYFLIIVFMSLAFPYMIHWLFKSWEFGSYKGFFLCDWLVLCGIFRKIYTEEPVSRLRGMKKLFHESTHMCQREHFHAVPFHYITELIIYNAVPPSLW
jgi:hypothetical protein